MAGGPNAESVACMYCANEAKRTSSGIEDDYYECTGCGKKFGICWEEGQPEKPRWPITDQERDEILEFQEKMKKHKFGACRMKFPKGDGKY
jgi:hypothetical protein